MNRIISRASAYIIGLGLVITLSSATTKTYYYGDLNHDGEVTVSDITLMLRHLAEHDSTIDGNTILNVNLRSADIDQNGIINRSDLQLLVDMVLGKAELIPMPDIGTGGSGKFD